MSRAERFVQLIVMLHHQEASVINAVSVLRVVRLQCRTTEYDKLFFLFFVFIFL